MDPNPARPPGNEGAYRYCPTCGTATIPGQTRCQQCGRLVRVPIRAWAWAVGVLGVLEAGWAVVHSRSAIEVVASGIAAAALIAAVIWVFVRNLARLGRRGGASKGLGVLAATLVTAALCLPIFTAMGREDASTAFAFGVTMVLMPLLIGVPAGLLLSRGSPTHVHLPACTRCGTYTAPDAGFCTACGHPVEPV